MNLPPMVAPMSRAERVQAALYSLIVVSVNALICRQLFSVPSAHMNSMHGFWAALARWAGDSWLHPSWWPYWDCGIPFEYTYAPLVPVLTSLVSWKTGQPLWMSVDVVSALVYCLGPVAFFVVAWGLTRGSAGPVLANAQHKKRNLSDLTGLLVVPKAAEQ